MNPFSFTSSISFLYSLYLYLCCKNRQRQLELELEIDVNQEYYVNSPNQTRVPYPSPILIRKTPKKFTFIH